MSFPATSGRLREALVRSVKGQVAMAGGRTREVLTMMDPPLRNIPYQQMIGSSFLSLPQDRYLFAEAAEASGREEEALRWFGSFEHEEYDNMFVGPGQLRMARIYEKLGKGKEAAQHYQRFVDLWSDADAVLKPAVDEAKAALARLTK